MRFSKSRPSDNATQAPLTSMVDIVFLLLIFFVMTFNVVPAEGDYAIDLSGGDRGIVIESVPVKVRIRPAQDSTAAPTISWQIGFREEQPVRDMQALNELAWKYVQREDRVMSGQPSGDSATLDVDPNLAYRHTIDALSALSARRHNGERVELFHKVSLAKH